MLSGKKAALIAFSVSLLMALAMSKPVFASGPTNVNGNVVENTTWSVSGSPYVVIENVLVSSGVTLTIDPGVVVAFEREKSLRVNGELIARGTNSERITFTSSQADPTAGDWSPLCLY